MPTAKTSAAGDYCVIANPERAAALIARYKPFNKASLHFGGVIHRAGLKKDAQDLALDLFDKTTEWMIEEDALCMAAPLATAQLLTVVREKGPEKYKRRRDANSGYSHEFGQVFYQYWMAEEPRRVVKRIVEERTGKPVDEAPPEMVEGLMRQLKEELSPENNALYAAGSISHDVCENYHISPDDYIAYIARHSGIDPDCAFMRDLRAVYVNISRHEGESEVDYMLRQTADLLTAFTKTKDRLHNMGTALLAGRGDDFIQTMCHGAEVFLERVTEMQAQRERPFLLLEYTSYYLRDQVRLYRLFYAFFDDNSPRNRHSLDDHMNMVKTKWGGSWMPRDIHPMLSITDRMDQILAAHDSSMRNPRAREQALAGAPSPRPGGGRPPAGAP